MNWDEIETVTLILDMFSKDLYAEEDTGDDEDEVEPLDVTITTVVKKLDSNHFRLAEPLSVTPFGQMGPQLNLGDEIEVSPIAEDGAFRYIRVSKRADVWTWTGNASKGIIAHPSVVRLLEELTEAGGNWEWTSSVIRIQFPNPDGNKEISTNISSIVESLTQLIGDGDNQSKPPPPTV